MEKKKVPIVYGLLLGDPYYDDAEITKFPHAQEWVAGGCMVGTEKYHETYVCPKCKDAREKWIQKNPKYKDWQASDKEEF